MENKEREIPPMEMPGAYGDGDIPEVDLPGKANATPDIPYEMPGRKEAGKNSK